MLLRDFPGAERFIHEIDEAVSADCTKAVTDRLRNTLCRMIRDRAVELPPCVFECCGDHYARRELYQSEEHGYSVVAMTWGPGQGTPIHDHCGLWCVEGVWQGQLEITRYELEEEDGDKARFSTHETLMAGAGSAGALLPPHEYHTIRNPKDDAIAISLHVYQKAMGTCATFEPLGGDWYQRGSKTLCLDQIPCDD